MSSLMERKVGGLVAGEQFLTSSAVRSLSFPGERAAFRKPPGVPFSPHGLHLYLHSRHAH